MSTPEQAPSRSSSFSIGLVISLLWVVIAAIYVQTRIGWSTIGDMPPGEMGGLLAGFATPLALLWLVLSAMRRGLSGGGGAHRPAAAMEE